MFSDHQADTSKEQQSVPTRPPQSGWLSFRSFPRASRISDTWAYSGLTSPADLSVDC